MTGECRSNIISSGVKRSPALMAALQEIMCINESIVSRRSGFEPAMTCSINSRSISAGLCFANMAGYPVIRMVSLENSDAENVEPDNIQPSNEIMALDHSGKLVAILEPRGSKWKPLINLSAE